MRNLLLREHMTASSSAIGFGFISVFLLICFIFAVCRTDVSQAKIFLVFALIIALVSSAFWYEAIKLKREIKALEREERETRERETEEENDSH